MLRPMLRIAKIVNVFATAHILKSKGVTFAQEPKTEVWGSLAVFKDPDGNQIELLVASKL